jgi:ubiquitin-like 1-activating enzyme E1 B
LKFSQLFGEIDPDDDVSPETTDETEMTSSQQENGTNSKDNDKVMEEPKRLNTRQFAEQKLYEPKALFDKLFHDDINYLLSMADLWKERKKPIPVHFNELVTSGFSN